MNPVTTFSKNAIYIFLALCLLQGCAASSTTKVYKAAYNDIVHELSKNLNIDSITENPEGGLIYKDTDYHNSLDQYLLSSMGFGEDKGKRLKPTYEIVEQAPGTKLIIKRFNYINMFASGKKGLLFKVEATTPDTTRVEVDYFSEAYWLGFIPMIFSGSAEEEYVHSLFFKNYKTID